jgi:hypothetical protein
MKISHRRKNERHSLPTPSRYIDDQSCQSASVFLSSALQAKAYSISVAHGAIVSASVSSSTHFPDSAALHEAPQSSLL